MSAAVDGFRIEQVELAARPGHHPLAPQQRFRIRCAGPHVAAEFRLELHVGGKRGEGAALARRARHQGRAVEGATAGALASALFPQMAGRDQSERALIRLHVIEIEHDLERAIARGIDVESDGRGRFDSRIRKEVGAPVLAFRVHHHRGRLQLGGGGSEIVQGRLDHAGPLQGARGEFPDLTVSIGPDHFLRGLEADGLAGAPHFAQALADRADQRLNGLVQRPHQLRCKLAHGATLRGELTAHLARPEPAIAEQRRPFPLAALGLVDPRLQRCDGGARQFVVGWEHAAIGGMGAIIDVGEAPLGHVLQRVRH